MRLSKIFLLLFVFFAASFAKAQFTDDFTDGDFTNNPAWSGDVTTFTVVSGQLRSNSSVASSNFYLSTPSAQATNGQWELNVNLQFNTSSANYTDIFLVSDSSNLMATSFDAYFVRIGNTSDDICLYKKVGGVNTILIDGTNGITNGSNNILKIKVTRDVSNLWTLQRDITGSGASYFTEGTVTDAAITTSAYFGIFIKQSTASFFNKHFYDSIYVGPIILDTNPPTIVSVVPVSSTQVDVFYNEAVDLTTSQTLTNYSANNGLGNPTLAIRDNINLSLVELTFATAFTNNLQNTLTISNVQDLSSNAILTANTNFTYFVAATPVYKDVIINEIFADPSPQLTLPLVEFIEIYNRSSNVFNLSGWTFTDGSSTGTLQSHILAPNSYLILCPIADTASFAPYGQYLGLSSFPSLNNTGDNLKLFDNTAVTIDSVDYLDTWYRDPNKAQGGWTLELINPNAPTGCPASGNWKAAFNPNGGTPDAQNSVYSTAPDITAPSISGALATDSTHISLCFSEAIDTAQLANIGNYSINGGSITIVSATPNSTFTCVDISIATALASATTYTLTLDTINDCSGNTLNNGLVTFSYYVPKVYDVVINEIMADPDPPVNLPNYEYAELYNRSAYAISLNGWKYSAGTSTVVLPDIILQGHGYVALASTTAAPNYPIVNNVVGITSFPGLTNTGTTLRLANAQDVVISTVSYTDNWYQNNAKQDGGWSIEQIDPNNPCSGMSNWRASVDALGGTPGLVNSVNATNPDNTAPQVVRVAVIAVDTIQVFFDEPLNPATMLDTTIYSINNGIGKPSLVIPVAPDSRSAILALNNALQLGIIYTLTLNNAITDCAGNLLGADNTAKFAIPLAAQPNDIIINEILSDPNTGGVDYVEIYNKSNKVIDLKAIRLSQYDTVNHLPTSIKTITTDGYLFFPNQYIVLSANSDAVKSQYYTSNTKGFIDLQSMITMSIASGTVCLSTVDSVIDYFIYYESMQFPLLNSSKGVSLERVSFTRSTRDASNWHSAAEAVGFGTPGYKNSQYNDGGESEDAFEITPEVFSPDEDGFNDIVSINYKFDTPGFIANVQVFDSKGRLVKHLVRNEYLGIKGTFSWDGITDERDKARIGIYVFYIEVFDLSGAVKKYKKSCVLASKL